MIENRLRVHEKMNIYVSSKLGKLGDRKDMKLEVSISLRRGEEFCGFHTEELSSGLLRKAPRASLRWMFVLYLVG